MRPERSFGPSGRRGQFIKMRLRSPRFSRSSVLHGLWLTWSQTSERGVLVGRFQIEIRPILVPPEEEEEVRTAVVEGERAKEKSKQLRDFISGSSVPFLEVGN